MILRALKGIELWGFRLYSFFVQIFIINVLLNNSFTFFLKKNCLKFCSHFLLLLGWKLQNGYVLEQLISLNYLLQARHLLLFSFVIQSAFTLILTVLVRSAYHILVVMLFTASYSCYHDNASDLKFPYIMIIQLWTRCAYWNLFSLDSKDLKCQHTMHEIL